MYEEIKQMAQRALSRLNNVLGRGKLNTFTYGKRPKANVSLFDQETYDDVEFAGDWGFMAYPPCDGNTELIVGFLRGMRDNGTVLRSFNRVRCPTTSNITLEEGECVLYNKVTNCYVYLKKDGTIIVRSEKEIDQIVKNNSITIKDSGGIVTVVGQSRVKIKIYDGDAVPFRMGQGSMGQPLSQDKLVQVDLTSDGNIVVKATKKVTLDTPEVYITGNLRVAGDITDKVLENSHTVKNMRTIFNNHVHSGVQSGPSNTGAPTTSQ